MSERRKGPGVPGGADLPGGRTLTAEGTSGRVDERMNAPGDAGAGPSAGFSAPAATMVPEESEQPEAAVVRSSARPLVHSGDARPLLARLKESARRTRALVRKELRQIFRDPKTQRVVLGAPILQLLLFGYAVTTDVRNVTTFVVDHDGSYASRSLQDAIQAGGYFTVIGRGDRSAAITDALDHGRATIGVEIPYGFQRDLAAGRGASVQVLVDGTNSNTGTVAQGYIGRIVQQFGLDYAREHGAALPQGVDLRARAWFNPALDSKTYNVPAVVGVLLSLMCLLLTSLAVVRERELGTLEQLMVSPLNATELILGKVVPVMIIGFIDLALVTTLALFWFRVPFEGSLLLLIGAAFLYILSAISLGLLISTVSNTQQEAFMGMFLVMLPMVLLSGFFFPIRSMPLFFQRLTLINPLRHFLEIVRAIFLKGAGLPELWPQFLAVTLAAALLLTLAIGRFRARLV